MNRDHPLRALKKHSLKKNSTRHRNPRGPLRQVQHSQSVFGGSYSMRPRKVYLFTGLLASSHTCSLRVSPATVLFSSFIRSSAALAGLPSRLFSSCIISLSSRVSPVDSSTLPFTLRLVGIGYVQDRQTERTSAEMNQSSAGKGGWWKALRRISVSDCRLLFCIFA
jgi:hypothetical protein